MRDEERDGREKNGSSDEVPEVRFVKRCRTHTDKMEKEPRKDKQMSFSFFHTFSVWSIRTALRHRCAHAPFPFGHDLEPQLTFFI